MIAAPPAAFARAKHHAVRHSVQHRVHVQSHYGSNAYRAYMDITRAHLGRLAATGMNNTKPPIV
jgi:hypothetical protein